MIKALRSKYLIFCAFQIPKTPVSKNFNDHLPFFCLKVGTINFLLDPILLAWNQYQIKDYPSIFNSNDQSSQPTAPSFFTLSSSTSV